METAINVGEVYALLVRDLLEGSYKTPGFQHAFHNARLIEAVMHSAERGVHQKVHHRDAVTKRMTSSTSRAAALHQPLSRRANRIAQPAPLLAHFAQPESSSNARVSSEWVFEWASARRSLGRADHVDECAQRGGRLPSAVIVEVNSFYAGRPARENAL
jgi:hypothetical protein